MRPVCVDKKSIQMLLLSKDRHEHHYVKHKCAN